MTALATEPTRAMYPDDEGFVERDGVRTFYEVYGDGEPTILFVPPWSLVHSRVWKAQIPYFARHYRVVVFDPRGNGRSDRPRDPSAYAEEEFAADALAVLDATATERAVVVGLSRNMRAMLLAADHPERVSALCLIASSVPLTRRSALPRRVLGRLFDLPTIPLGFGRFNARSWRRDYRGFLDWFCGPLVHPEKHSTRQVEQAVEWGLQTDPETLIATERGSTYRDRGSLTALARRVGCPTLVIHGERDRIGPVRDARVLARLTRGELVVLPGVGHNPEGRNPVQVNLALRDFVERTAVARGAAAATTPA